jgi:hypothetical protein
MGQRGELRTPECKCLTRHTLGDAGRLKVNLVHDKKAEYTRLEPRLDEPQER